MKKIAKYVGVFANDLKKIFSITLLLLFLFQFVGYYLVYLGLRYQAKSTMISRLDSRNYSDDETITLKIPFGLPYWADSKEYERVNGEFQYGGEFYKLVKQKLEKDTIYVVCIRDINEKRLFHAMTDFAKLSNDLPSSSQQTLKLFGNLLKDYVPGEQTEISSSQGWLLTFSFADRSYPLWSLSSLVSTPPPQPIG